MTFLFAGNDPLTPVCCLEIGYAAALLGFAIFLAIDTDPGVPPHPARLPGIAAL